MKKKFNTKEVENITFVMEDKDGNKKSFKEKDLSTLIFFGAGFNGKKDSPDALIRLSGEDKFFYGGFGMLLESIVKKIGLLDFIMIITELLQSFGVPMSSKKLSPKDLDSLDDNLFDKDIFKDDLSLKKPKNKIPN